MRKLLTIGLIVLMVSLAACSTYEEPIEEKQNTETIDIVETGDKVLDTIADAPEEVVNEEELDTIMDDISMDDW